MTLIDWDDEMRQRLEQRFPEVSPAEIRVVCALSREALINEILDPRADGGVIQSARRFVTAAIAEDRALGALLAATDPNENDRCRDAHKEAAREMEDALAALAAAFGETWPVK